uniref:Uncharacterized protein n=1 Tax=Desulfomonile tiedjei TaxID=2358 RepID=A0A7C4EY58_9BACT
MGNVGVAMIVVLTCFQDGKPFLPLTRNRPVAMLPFMNVPIIQSHIERFVEAGFSRFIVVAVDYPLPLQEFLGDGSRWGAHIEVVVLKDPCEDFSVLDRLSFKLQGETAILMPAEIILNLNIPNLVAFQSAGNDPYVKVFARNILEVLHGANLPKPTFKKKRLDPLVYTGVMVASADARPEQAGASYLYEDNFMTINNPVALWAANMAGLGGFFSAIGSRYFSGQAGDIRIGHHFRRGTETEIVAPALIGHHVRINPRASLYGWTVLGNGVFVDKGAHVGRSVIADHTYIGSETSVEHAVVEGKLIYNLEIGEWVEVTDSFIISDIREEILTSVLQSAFWRLTALACLTLAMPLILCGAIVRKIRGKDFFETRRWYVTAASFLGAKPPQPTTVSCISFHEWNSLIGRLPALFHVVLGRIRLVGVRPLEDNKPPLYEEEWTLLREEAPCGLFTPVDAEGIHDGSEEAKIVAENYYAATRSLSGDVKIFFLAVLKLFRLSIMNVRNKLVGNAGRKSRKELETS